MIAKILQYVDTSGLYFIIKIFFKIMQFNNEQISSSRAYHTSKQSLRLKS